MDNDLISRSAFIDWIDVGHLRSPSEKCLSELDVRRMIELQPAVSNEWISVKDRLPCKHDDGAWKEYVVLINESHFPTSSYDICDAPYDREYVTTALFDADQKVWHLLRGEICLNALLDIDDTPINGIYVTHYQPLPAPHIQRQMGHWIRVDDAKCRCSECDMTALIVIYPHGDKKYCPNCGVRMLSTGGEDYS